MNSLREKEIQESKTKMIDSKLRKGERYTVSNRKREERRRNLGSKSDSRFYIQKLKHTKRRRGIGGDTLKREENNERNDSSLKKRK